MVAGLLPRKCAILSPVAFGRWCTLLRSHSGDGDLEVGVEPRSNSAVIKGLASYENAWTWMVGRVAVGMCAEKLKSMRNWVMERGRVGDLSEASAVPRELHSSFVY